MTRDEFKTTFEDFLKDPTANMDKALAIQNEVLTMYDTHETMQTSIDNAKKQYDILKSENDKLKEANFQLFMATGFAGTNPKDKPKEDPDKPNDEPSDNDDNPDFKPMSAEDLVNSLLGKGESK